MSSRNSSHQTKSPWIGASALGLTTLLVFGLAAPETHAQGTSTPPPGLVTITQPTDGIISADAGAPNPTGSNDTSNGAAKNAIDNNPATSYINTTGAGSGLMITPSIGSVVVTELSLTSSADTPGSEPTSFALFASTDPNAPTDGNFVDFYAHSIGNGGIGFTSLGQTLYIPVSLDGGTTINSTPYSSYFLLFTQTASSAPGTNLQIAEVGLMAAAPEPSQYAALGLGVLSVAGLVLKARKRQAA